MISLKSQGVSVRHPKMTNIVMSLNDTFSFEKESGSNYIHLPSRFILNVTMVSLSRSNEIKRKKRLIIIEMQGKI